MTDIEKVPVKEEWRSVKGAEDDYLVSSTGRVKSRYRRWRTIAGTMSIHGYRTYGIKYNGKEKKKYAHALVLDAFMGGRRAGLVVNHIDANKLNNCFLNLELITNTENVAHATRLGLVPRGEINGSAKLKGRQVLEIRMLSKTGVSKRELGRRFGVDEAAIRLIVSGRTWRHI